MNETRRDTEPDESFLQAIAGEVFAFATVFGSFWRVLRHPWAFDDHLIYRPKQIVRFFFVSAGLATFFAGILFSTPGAEHTGLKLEAITTLHRLLPGLHTELQGEDIVPLALLVLAVVAGCGVHGVWRCGRWLLSDRAKAWLRKPPGVPGARLTFAIGAFVYSVGVVVLSYALFASLALIHSDSPSAIAMAVFRALTYALDALLCYAMLIFMVATPVWIARLYGVRIWALPAVGYVTLLVIAVFGLPLSAAYRSPPDRRDQLTLFSESATLPFEPASGKPAHNPQPELQVQGGLPIPYQDMLERIFDSARNGNPAAQTVLGWLCQNGWGLDCDRPQTAAWFRKAADQGDADAANTLGVLVLKQLGSGGDYSEVFSLFHKAAEQGLASAQSNLGWLYQHGWGAPQDFGMAMTWYRQAADRGDAVAADHIGLLVQNGQGTQADPAAAVGWFRKAAAGNDADAENNLGLAYVRGLGVVTNGHDAEAWFIKSASRDYGPAQANLGWMYQHGVGVLRDDGKARAWQQRATSQGVTRATVAEVTLADFNANVGDRIFFAPASPVIQPHAAVILLRQAEWLKQNAGASVTIEGHADGQEAPARDAAPKLGGLRAMAVKDFLVLEGGIAADRIRTISYGKERPSATGPDEAAQAQNRLAVTTID